MNTWIKNIFLLWSLTIALAQGADVKSRISSAFLARGEKTLLEIRIQGTEPDGMPVIPEVKDLLIEPLGYGPPTMMPGRRIEYSFQYVVSSYEIGVHTIPSIEVIAGGVRSITEPIGIEVFNPDDLTWGEAVSKPESSGETVKYASIIKVPKKKVYENQTIETEIKIYVPRDLARTMADWGVPEFDREGLAAWRFEATDGRGEINLLGQSYIAISYSSTMTALKPGTVTIGPATVRLTYVKMVFDRFAQRVDVEATLDVAEYSFEITPLPEGAPDGFDNAVGDFTVGTAIKQTKVTEGEPMAVDVIVSGSGNLDNIRSPELIDPEGWKVYDATPNQRGEERRELSGTVVFSQFIRPLEMKTAVPPFRMVYFDPTTEEYKTITTEPIAIEMSPAALGRNFEASGPPPALSLPIERMTDILGVIGDGKLLRSRGGLIPWWIFHVLAGLLALGLIAKALWMRYSHLLEKDERKARMKKEFQEVLTAKGRDGIGFLRIAGGFVEKWLSPVDNAELGRIIEERDELCFRAAKQDADLPANRREQILRTLRRAAFGVLFLAFAGLSVSSANAQDVAKKAKEAFDSAKYEEAASLWLEAGSFESLSADTLYNIGNAAYRMGAPGEAALYYRRALAREGSHQEARQNLRFIERKYGSVTVDRPSYQYAIAEAPLGVWKAGMWTGAWILVVGLLVFPATRYGSRLRVAAVVGFILGPILVSLGGLGWYHFPNDAEFAPIASQAVIVGEKVVLHTDAARTSPEVIDAPVGSLAEVIQMSGRWAYVGFATKTRGWVPVESIEMIIPAKKPNVPKVRKADTTGASA